MTTKRTKIKTITASGDLDLELMLSNVNDRVLDRMLLGTNKPWWYADVLEYLLHFVQAYYEKLSEGKSVNLNIHDLIKKKKKEILLTPNLVKKLLGLYFLDEDNRIQLKYNRRERNGKMVWSHIWLVAPTSYNMALFSGIVVEIIASGTAIVVEEPNLLTRKDVERIYLTITVAKRILSEDSGYKMMSYDLETREDKIFGYVCTEELHIALNFMKEEFKRERPKQTKDVVKESRIRQSSEDLAALVTLPKKR